MEDVFKLRPITWQVYQRLPKTAQANYYSQLKQRFNIPDSALAAMMGTSETTMQKHHKARGIQAIWKKKDMETDDIGWKRFCAGEPVDPSPFQASQNTAPFQCSFEQWNQLSERCLHAEKMCRQAEAAIQVLKEDHSALEKARCQRRNIQVNMQALRSYEKMAPNPILSVLLSDLRNSLDLLDRHLGEDRAKTENTVE